jgi:FkbM family methyltransferase
MIDALSHLGKDAATRARIIAALQEFEFLPQYRFTRVRDEITGPVVDALLADAGILHKELSNGIVFDFFYRSKITRDFVMSREEKPDHVWEPQATRLMVHLAARAAHMLIGGAYFGDQAIPVAHQLRGHGGTCHAFEPDADQAAMLAHNAALNGLDNIRVHASALWSDSDAMLQLEGPDSLAVTLPYDGGALVPVTTIDEYLEAEGVERVNAIMLDLEGSELEALRGAQRQLSLSRESAPNLVFEVHGARDDWSHGLQQTEVYRYVASFGYSIYAIRDMQSNEAFAPWPIELVPAETAFLDGPPHGFNMFAMKDQNIIANECFAIVPNVSPKLLLHRDPALHAPRGGFPC